MTEHLLSRAAWRDAIKASALSPNARHVAKDMSDYWKTGDFSPVLWCPNEVLASTTGLSVSTVTRARRELARGGWIQVERGATGHMATRYRPTIPAGFSTEGGHCDHPATTGKGCLASHGDHPGSALRPPTISTVTTESLPSPYRPLPLGNHPVSSHQGDARDERTAGTGGVDAVADAPADEGTKIHVDFRSLIPARGKQ